MIRLTIDSLFNTQRLMPPPSGGWRGGSPRPGIMKRSPSMHTSVNAGTQDEDPGQAIAPRGFKHQIALALIDRGCTWRQAHKAVDLFFHSIKVALRRHETVDLPFGTFSVVPVPQRRHRRWRFGQPQEVFRKRYRVVFTPRDLE